ncbi:family 20 glycosylhydrolase [Yinghuangia soli]|uniref:beta-N-acetylhexosaminidase n=1 Tax=Yinghuangia soli TaxID=2908204 RepID=A0AA41Q036_9ACTN|nr:family 20 glycosylhydrolase [Yinghuangia soli]MCF2528851.1 beta-N-acetylhexosaminidase [Yinghuangia soli]
MNSVIPRLAAPSPEASGAGTRPAAGVWAVRAADPSLEAVAETVRALLAPHLPRVTAADPSGAPRAIVLVHEEIPHAPVPLGLAVADAEHYRIRVDATGITCRAGTAAGVFRAATTAIQLITTGADLTDREVADGPRHAWRGLLVDPARGFVTAEELRRVVDVAALYKLNVLHLHLSDNEGWRLELPGLPELTAAGDGRFYTVQEYRDLQAYATARFVTLVPEIDLPGHCGALRAAFPGLPEAPMAEEDGGIVELLGNFMTLTPPVDLEDDGTARLVERIIEQVCALTDGGFVHVGADEAVGMCHRNYAAAVARLRETVRKFGKQPIAWQEASRTGVEPGDVVQYWLDGFERGDGGSDGDDNEGTMAALGLSPETADRLRAYFAPVAEDLARIVRGGGRVLLSPRTSVYLDRPYAASSVPEEQRDTTANLGLAAYPGRPLADLAAWDPAALGIPDDQVAGIEAALWGETIDGIDDLTMLLLPRLPAVAEAAWSGGPAPWDDYRGRLARHGRLWSERGLAYLAAREIDWQAGDG